MYRQERESGYSPVVSRLRIIQGSSQMYMLSLFHGENMGSIPLGRANEINQLVHKICGVSFTNAASADANADDASDGAHQTVSILPSSAGARRSRDASAGSALAVPMVTARIPDAVSSDVTKNRRSMTSFSGRKHTMRETKCDSGACQLPPTSAARRARIAAAFPRAARHRAGVISACPVLY
jgi:hypothetical protein